MESLNISGQTPDFIHVNLLPIEYRVVRKDYSFLLDLRVLISIIALLAMGAGYLVGQSYFHANLASKKNTLAKIQAEIGANAYVATRIKELEKLRDEKTAKNNSLKSISVSKKKWVRILEGINKSMPLNMWIESIKQPDANDNEMEIKGRTLVFPEIAEYMLDLEKNEYFTKVFLNSIELQKEQERSSFVYTIRISINANVGIDVTPQSTLPSNILASPPPTLPAAKKGGA